MEQLQLDDFLMYNFLSQVQISPDGKKVAYVATTPDLAKNGYNANLYRIDAESGENACLTNSGRVKGFCWQGAETLLYTVPVEADDAFPDGQTVLYRQNAGSAAAGQRAAKDQATDQSDCPDGAPFKLGAADLLQWRIRDSFCLVAPEGRLDEAASTALASMASTLRLNPSIAREACAQKQQMVLEQRQSTQMNIAQQQQQFAAWHQMHASQQAAFDSYQQAWFERSDRQHAANMAASAANFSSAGVGTGAASYSDAIRGVNHYTRPDGTDVEVSVMADQAWVNGSGDVIGTRDGFEPGFGWTELPRQ